MKKIIIILTAMAIIATISCKKEEQELQPSVVQVDFRDVAEGNFIFGEGTRDEMELIYSKNDSNSNLMTVTNFNDTNEQAIADIDSIYQGGFSYELDEDDIVGFYDSEEDVHSLVFDTDTLAFVRKDN
jgi:hypothetical protein